MSISREDVAKVALLGRLTLTEAELTRMTEQLVAIVGYVDQLGELDTADVSPMAHAVELENVFREDAVRPSLSREEALRNAPASDGEFYHVPAVLGE